MKSWIGVLLVFAVLLTVTYARKEKKPGKRMQLEECNATSECPQPMQCCPGWYDTNVSYCQNISKLNEICDLTGEGGCGCEAELTCSNRTHHKGGSRKLWKQHRKQHREYYRHAAGVCLDNDADTEDTTQRPVEQEAVQLQNVECEDVCTNDRQCCPGMRNGSDPSCQKLRRLNKKCDPDGERGCGCEAGLTCEERPTKSGKKKSSRKLRGVCRQQTTE